MKQKINILVDYRSRFMTKSTDPNFAVDKTKLAECFNKLGWEAVYRKFSDIDFRNDNYEKQFILYCSSEDEGLHYKDFIEDVLLGLEIQQAVLIPGFYYFRAHSNKVFAEILRDTMNSELIGNIRSHYYGTYEEYRDKADAFGKTYPVIKASEGCCGQAVFLSDDRRTKDKIIKKISRTPASRQQFIFELKRKIKLPAFGFPSVNRKKFQVQSFVPGLQDDWKVLMFDKKCYIFNRKVRENDFRASGAGRFDFQMAPPPGLLDFAKSCFDVFNAPYASFDICFDGKAFYLLEFQFLAFGTKGLEKSSRYFTHQGGTWKEIPGKSVLEEEMANSVVAWVQRNYPC